MLIAAGKGDILTWDQTSELQNKKFICGYCQMFVSSKIGYRQKNDKGLYVGAIYICPSCFEPIYFSAINGQYPKPNAGRPVSSLPDGINELYEEARRCIAQRCYTSSVMLLRKMLMNIAVEQGAQKGKRFIDYVEYLSEKGFVPPNGKAWVDHIRKKGNEATHEIVIMSEKDAAELIVFVEMLLRFIYELPVMMLANSDV